MVVWEVPPNPRVPGVIFSRRVATIWRELKWKFSLARQTKNQVRRCARRSCYHVFFKNLVSNFEAESSENIDAIDEIDGQWSTLLC